MSGARLHEDPLNLPANRSKSLSDSRLAQRILIGATLCLLVAIPMGCIFSPHKDDTDGGGGGPPEYPKLVNPFYVLDALSKAYKKRTARQSG